VIEKENQQADDPSLTFIEILEEMNRAGGFSRSVLATSEGLPIASYPENLDMELASAMIALLQKVSAETQGHLGMEPVDEVVIRTQDQVHLVCRTINSGSEWLSLCAVVPPGHYYRRITNRAVRKIRQVIES
jgi:predicted regulator of Ras-like GTPase activity (Roadblock/LC7/MglB family)